MRNKQPTIYEGKLINDNQQSAISKNPKSMIKIGYFFLIFGFIGFLIWAFTAKLDEGVPVSGSVIVDTKRRMIQHFTGGVIKQIFVKDGDHVKKGQLLVELDPTQSRASISINKQTINSLTQEIESLDHQITRTKPLVNQGFYPLVQLSEMERQLIQLENQKNDAQQRLKVSQEEYNNSKIISPDDGIIMNNLLTKGSVIRPGESFMELEPILEKLVLDIQIPTHLIDKIHPGLQSEIRFPALNQRTTPVLYGSIIWVSPDKIQDPRRPEVAYYSGRVAINNDSFTKLKNEKILAGMPAEVIIKTGSRTFWDYLIKPVEDRMALSLKER